MSNGAIASQQKSKPAAKSMLKSDGVHSLVSVQPPLLKPQLRTPAPGILSLTFHDWFVEVIGSHYQVIDIDWLLI